MKKMNKKAFTLIELIVVVAVVGILVLLGMPRFIGYKDKAELARIQHDVKVMEQEVGTVLINNDDVFDKWEDNDKDFNQLIQESRLFEKEGIAEAPIGGSYKVIPEEYKDKINTKLKGTFYANNNGKVYYEHEKPLLGIPAEPEEKEPVYSDEEIDDLIKKHKFIPIATAEELNSIRNTSTRTYGKGTKWENEYTGGLNKKYVQVANIDLSKYSIEEEGWNPIGTYISSKIDGSFTGIYDGGNYVIRGLEVKGDDKDEQGLFGYTEGATISNVSLEGVNVTGKDYVGGLVGDANDSLIENSYATGSVTGKDYVGGLVGDANDSLIENSYATGSVTGESYVGGLVGYAGGWGSNNKITNSYATGSVTGAGNYVGGLVGYASDSTIENSYSTGSVTGTTDVGGLAGMARESTIINSYATGAVEGSGSNIGGLAGMARESTIINSYATGAVEGSYDVGGLAGSAWYNTDIINSYATGSVKGTGNGNVGGLAGSASSDTTISNSYAKGKVTGGKLVGGLVGKAQGGTGDSSTEIINSYATGKVTGEEYVGGLVGRSDNSTTISNSYAKGKVTGEEYVGGLVGYTGSTTISNSYATGSVTGTGTEGAKGTGGLVGYISGFDTKISNSYATGEVTGTTDYIGGLVGYIGGFNNEINNSYWNKDTTKQTTSAGQDESFGKTTEEMMDKDTYLGWGFDEIWEVQEGVSYPTLINNPERH